MKQKIVIYFVLLLSVSSIQARGIYQEPAEFLNETFKKGLPQAKVIWLTGQIRADATKILQHKPDQLRVRYWQKGQRSAWILNEIGKEKPITVGVIVNKNKIEKVKVLIFRESRGDEIRHAFFTQQFKKAEIHSDTQLDRPIDGISGATMSVRALTKLSRLALLLSSKIK